MSAENANISNIESVINKFNELKNQVKSARENFLKGKTRKAYVNDELGEHIGKTDIGQIRYFNKPIDAQNKGIETELDVVEGMQFDRGYLSPYFITNSDKMTTELENPFILLHEKKLTNLQPMVPLLEAVVQAGRPLMIISEDVEGEALAT